MIVQEMAYKISLKANDFLNGKRKVEVEAADLANKVSLNNKVLGQSFGNITDGMNKFGAAGKSAFSLVQSNAARFLGVALTLEGARRMFMGTTEQLVRMGNSAAFLGMSTQSLDGFTRAAQSAGVSGEAMGSMLMRLKNAQLQVQTGLGAPDAATIAIRQMEGNTGIDILGAKDPGQMLLRQAQALRRLPAAQAQALWGQAGGAPEMFNLMRNGNLDTLVSQYTKSSNATPAAVKQAQQVQKALTDLKQTVDNIGITLVQVFGPDITKGLEGLDKWIKDNKGNILDFFKDTSTEAQKLTDAVGGIGNLLKIYAGWKVGGVYGAAIAAGYSLTDKGMSADEDQAKKEGKTLGQYLIDKVNQPKTPFIDTNAPTVNTMNPFGLPTNNSNPYSNTGGYSAPAGSDLWSTLSRLFFPEAGASTVSPRLGGKYAASGSLMNALMMAESGGNPLAYNASSGAAGAYQFMPGTARDMGLVVNGQQDDRLDPEKSRAAASIYMSRLLTKYNGNVSDALRAYNWGPGNMDKWIAGGRNGFMPKETQDYPGRVAGYYSKMARNANSSVGYGSMDNSTTSSTHIENVNVTSNPQTVDQLTSAIQEQAARSRVTVSFSGGVNQ